MPFKVRRINEQRQTSQDSPQTFANRRLAFDAAWDNAGAFIKANIRAAHTGDPDNPPSIDARYKIWVELRPGHGRGIELRFDYPEPGGPVGRNESNSIYWRIVQVP